MHSKEQRLLREPFFVFWICDMSERKCECRQPGRNGRYYCNPDVPGNMGKDRNWPKTVLRIQAQAISSMYRWKSAERQETTQYSYSVSLSVILDTTGR